MHPQATNISDRYIELVTRISDLEREREVLIKELVDDSINVLDPTSELSGLLEQLNDGSAKEREQAVTALFALEDIRSIPSLIAHLNNRRREALNQKYLFQWYDFMWNVDMPSAITFAISELESTDDERISDAFSELMKAPIEGSEDYLREMINNLEAIAVTNSNALIRTNAKLVIQRIGSLVIDSDEEIPSSDGYNSDDPRSSVLVYSLFSQYGMYEKFLDLVGDSVGVTYWKTALYIMDSFSEDIENREQYISILEALVEEDMSANSLGFTLYSLARMETVMGRDERAAHWTNECRIRVSRICENLLSNEMDLEQQTSPQ